MTVLAVAAGLLSLAPASASSYRYWSFWEGTGSGWTYQSAGPNTYRPADGSVDGWRFGVSADSADGVQPGRVPDFATACAGTPAVSGKKRVAVVIDYGTPADAPSGSTPPVLVTKCGVLAPDATSAQLLAQVAPPLRYNSDGILCAISGYPSTGCGDVVSGTNGATATSTPAASTTAASTPATSTPAASASAAPTSGPASPGRTVGWLVGVVLVLALAGGAFWQTRRRH
ncbi:SCO2322 family protein [Streptacidiphilus sp. N1-3]|uniref:SCO2322 family protein n=1 Tax=Streptacidiphilus alkalitolerans TaxID=3342712 RepID=A0ABV6WUI9_9ACTN